MAIEKEKFFEIIRNVSESEGLNKDNLLERIGSELKGVNPEAYSTYNNLKIDKLFMIQDLDKIASYTLLHLAVECNSVPIVKLLLEKKVKVDEQISGDVNSKFTALHIAALHGHQEIVQLLLNNNANPSLKDSQGRTPRDIVGDVEGKKAIIKMLEEGEQRCSGTRRQTYRQGTLLQPNNKTPGNLAVGGNKITAAVQAWNAKGQGENNGTTPNNRKIYVQNENEQTSSNSIINENNTDKVDDTLEREQAIRERDAMLQKLQEAEQRLANHQKRVEQDYLHNQHPEQYTTHNGEQIFLNKSSSDDSGICFDADESEALGQSILENGEDINAQDENGLTFLHRAAANDNEESVKLLVEYGADRSLIKDEGLVIDRLNSMCDQPSEVVSSTSFHSKTHNATETPEEAEKVKKLRVKLKKSHAQLKDKQKKNELLEQKIQDLESEKATLNSELEKTKTKTDEVPLEKAQKELTELRSHVTEYQSKLEALEKQNQEEKESLKQKMQDLGNENARLKNELDTTKNQHSETKALLEKTQKELEESKSCIARHETKLKEFNKENESLRQEIKNLKNENTPLKSELGKTKTNEVSLEKVGKRQFSPKVAYASLAAMLVVGAALVLLPDCLLY